MELFAQDARDLDVDFSRLGLYEALAMLHFCRLGSIAHDLELGPLYSEDRDTILEYEQAQQVVLPNPAARGEQYQSWIIQNIADVDMDVILPLLLHPTNEARYVQRTPQLHFMPVALWLGDFCTSHSVDDALDAANLVTLLNADQHVGANSVAIYLSSIWNDVVPINVRVDWTMWDAIATFRIFQTRWYWLGAGMEGARPSIGGGRVYEEDDDGYTRWRVKTDVFPPRPSKPSARVASFATTIGYDPMQAFDFALQSPDPLVRDGPAFNIGKEEALTTLSTMTRWNQTARLSLHDGIPWLPDFMLSVWDFTICWDVAIALPVRRSYSLKERRKIWKRFADRGYFPATTWTELPHAAFTLRPDPFHAIDDLRVAAFYFGKVSYATLIHFLTSGMYDERFQHWIGDDHFDLWVEWAATLRNDRSTFYNISNSYMIDRGVVDYCTRSATAVNGSEQQWASAVLGDATWFAPHHDAEGPVPSIALANAFLSAVTAAAGQVDFRARDWLRPNAFGYINDPDAPGKPAYEENAFDQPEDEPCLALFKLYIRPRVARARPTSTLITSEAYDAVMKAPEAFGIMAYGARNDTAAFVPHPTEAENFTRYLYDPNYVDPDATSEDGDPAQDRTERILDQWGGLFY